MLRAMKIVDGLPPNYEEITAAFPEVLGNNRVIFVYGDVLYARGNDTVIKIPHELKVHELTHMMQQANIGGPKIWWEQYIRNHNFRLLMEAQAFGMQLNSLPRGQREKSIGRISGELQRPIYNFNITDRQAREAIWDSCLDKMLYRDYLLYING